jgi:WhiB family redox-sensing transcriptional regulator
VIGEADVVDNWRQEAACRGLDTAIFFPSTDAEAGPAKTICATCPVRDECLEWAIATRQEDGVWGGMTDNERRRLRRRRRDAARRAAAASAA